MVTILGKSNKACFLCRTTQKTADVKFKDGSFAGALCMEHLYERLQERTPPKKDAQTGAES
jgi:hypothetical protein